MTLTFYFFTPFVDDASEADGYQPNAFNQPYFDRMIEGISEAEMEMFGRDYTDNWDEIYRANPESDTYKAAVQQLGIKKFPAMVVYDSSRNLALAKFEKRDITVTNVRNALVLSWLLTPVDNIPESPDAYMLPDGQTITAWQIMNADPCPDWVKLLPKAAQAAFCNKYGLQLPSESSNNNPYAPKWMDWAIAALLLVVLILLYRKFK